MLVHAFNLSQGLICCYAKGARNPAIEEHKQNPDAIVEVASDLPAEWATVVNRANREAEFHYLFADYEKDPLAEYSIKMTAQHLLVTNKISITLKVDRVPVLAQGAEWVPLAAREGKQSYVI